MSQDRREIKEMQGITRDIEEFDYDESEEKEYLDEIEEPLNIPVEPPILHREVAFIHTNTTQRRLADALPLSLDDDVEDKDNTDYQANGIPCPQSGDVIEAKAIILKCSICHVNQIQTVNFPCMHACFCLSCVRPAIMHSNVCPQCREQYMHISMLYLCYNDASHSDIKEGAVTSNKRKCHEKNEETSQSRLS
jgi:hypothetical protein